MKIVVNTKSEMKATGLPKGAMIEYSEAPAFMQKRYDDMMGSKPSEECVKRNADAYIDALKMRERVATFNGTHAHSNSEYGRTILSLIQTADNDGSKAITA